MKTLQSELRELLVAEEKSKAEDVYKRQGNVSAKPDYIILSLNIEVLSETYDRAMSEAAERIEDVYKRQLENTLS